jgi:hypothetical protein
MNIDENRIYKFISSGMVATLSVVVTSFTALYLASLDEKIGYGGNGVFYIQIAFTPQSFSAVLQSWGEISRILLMKYLYTDTIFTVLCAICFPAVMALLFTQYQEIVKKVNSEGDIHPKQYKARNIIIFFAPASIVFSLIGNGLIYLMVKTGSVNGIFTVIGATAQCFRIGLLFLSLGFVLYILLKRRKYIKELYHQG